MATTADDVWRLLGELVEAQKETERRFQASDRRLQETERLLREQSQETERLLKEQNQATERLLKEQSQRVDQQLGKLGNRLGEFVEYQVRPAAVRLFRERGIEVREISSDLSLQSGNEGIEIDILVVNGTEAIAIEVKSKLGRDDVDEHLERLAKFKRLLPRYQSFNVLGAVAGMVIPQEVARYAYRQGLFVIAQSGESLAILNDANFKPKAW
ncbi:DUF3782 domain-containing protein [Synechocystis sp. PCC 7339]|uniref:hypothetical protein n=1 Tax=unclassified Synechocystis TaxID=2640012 RepID=UPI001BAE99BA|nr:MULTISPECIES: hypothetical protein [unclassified Synechocystis]QUS59576.1 DUF3782 domain-containing protein [Synechocystis sp. PCC 7338]UAJ71762.1 DUF3782 domain-containing protein [Synechocystis sp. PCC 7339]